MKKKKFFIFITLIFCVLLISGCLENDKSKKDDMERLEGLGYINEVFMYGFNPPDGFYLKEEVLFNQYVVFEYLPYENETGQLGLYIYSTNVSSNISFPNRSIEKIAKELKENLANNTNYALDLISYDFKTFNDMDFYEILLETPFKEYGEKYFVWKYIYVVKDDRMITIQIIGSLELYNKYINDINNSLNSLIILKLVEEKWDLEKYYKKDIESNNTYIMTARQHYNDRRVIVYFSNIKIFYNTSNDGDTIIIQDNISEISYDMISNTTIVSFNWDNQGLEETLNFLFQGNITNKYTLGERVNITVNLKRVTFSHKGINYEYFSSLKTFIRKCY